jgi:predicted nucleic acid-binding protein
VTDFLLDTTFFIDLRRGINRGAQSLWDQLQAGETTAAYSPITIYELWVGQRLDRAEEVFYEAVLNLLEEAPLTSAMAKAAAAWLRQMGSVSESLIRDALIAATAVARGDTVRTLNARDFSRFPVEVEPY